MAKLAALKAWVEAQGPLKESGFDVLGRPVGYVVPPEDRQPIVTDWSGYDDYVNAPPDYDTFTRQYYQFTRWLVGRSGFLGSDFDDVVSELLIRFWERDSIGVFRREWKTRSKDRTSNFRSYYSRFVVTYLPGKKRNYARHINKNLLIFDAPVPWCENTTWAELRAPGSEFTTPSLDNAEFYDLVDRIKGEIDESLYDALFALIDIALEKDSVSAGALAVRLGSSSKVAKEQFAQLKAAVARVVGTGV